MTTRFVDQRHVKRLAIAVAAVAVWLVGAVSSAQAGCGDYLVGVEPNQGHHAVPMAPDHDQTPQCRSCNQPASPTAPVIQFERLPVESAFQQVGSSMILERGGWDGAHFTPRCQILSLTPDRPPKV